MGYYSRVEGCITITPPLTNAQVKLIPTVEPTSNWEMDLEVELVSNYRSVEIDGEMVDVELVNGTAITCSRTADFKAYYLKEMLQAIVNISKENTYTGQFTIYGAEGGDISRLIVKNGVAVKEKAEILFEPPQSVELAATLSYFRELSGQLSDALIVIEDAGMLTNLSYSLRTAKKDAQELVRALDGVATRA